MALMGGLLTTAKAYTVAVDLILRPICAAQFVNNLA